MTPSTQTNDRGAPTAATVPEPVRAGAFWAAVLLPFCALALLAIGLSSRIEYLIFASLVAVNIVALILGHGYGHE